jgi:tRNA(His) 5'-end guanylyltransferase
MQDLGDRQKSWEKRSELKMLPFIPTMARIDGRCFHSFTKGMNRPYDLNLSKCMILTTKSLAQETNADIGYAQSDEITLVWLNEEKSGEIWFDGKHSKMVSQLAAIATLNFFVCCMKFLPDYVNRMPTFDARVWQVPNKTEACNAILWRELDATKNSISMAARAYYSHKEVEGKNNLQKQDMLHEKGVNWDSYPAFFKRGTYVQKTEVEKPFSKSELEKLPEKHEARKNPDLKIKRKTWEVLDMPIFSKIKNKEEVVFCGEKPIVEKKMV